MKTMYVMLAGLFLLCISTGKVNASDDLKSKVKGKWEVTVPDAPSEFQKFTLEFKEKDNEIFVDFKGGDFDMKNQKFTMKDGKLTATINVGEYVKLLVWDDKGVIKGSADTSMGTLPIIFKKK